MQTAGAVDPAVRVHVDRERVSRLALGAAFRGLGGKLGLVFGTANRIRTPLPHTTA